MTKKNGRRELKTLKACDDCKAYIGRLEKKIEKVARIKRINKTLFGIANAVSATSSPDELYRSIHQLLSHLMDVTNFILLFIIKNEMLFGLFMRWIPEMISWWSG